MPKMIRPKYYTGGNVYDAAIKRVERAFQLFDRLSVSFSGGKDSTAVLNIVLQVARKLGRTPIDAHFFDEECCAPETIDYVRRIYNSDEVNLKWLCVPITSTNGCSDRSPNWYPWAEEDREKWVRELPKEQTPFPAFKRGMKHSDINHLIYPGRGSLGVFLGIRTQESIRRYQAVANKDTDAWITRREHFSILKPIYDWDTNDVWKGPQMFGWDYNRAYDHFEMLGIARTEQRVSPPYAVQPLKNLSMWQEIWPELWAKMENRVPGVRTAVRHSRTQLYGAGTSFQKPEQGWQFFIAEKLKKFPPKDRKFLIDRIKNGVADHVKLTNDPIPDDKPHDVSGLCWRALAKAVARNDQKNRIVTKDGVHIRKKREERIKNARRKKS